MVWRLGVLALVVVALCSRVGGEQLAATAITLLPFADKGSNDADSWIVPNQRANHGPMGAYLSVMLKACGHVDGLNVTRWASSQREAEYGLVFKQVRAELLSLPPERSPRLLQHSNLLVVLCLL